MKTEQVFAIDQKVYWLHAVSHTGEAIVDSGYLQSHGTTQAVVRLNRPWPLKKKALILQLEDLHTSKELVIKALALAVEPSEALKEEAHVLASKLWDSTQYTQLSQKVFQIKETLLDMHNSGMITINPPELEETKLLSASELLKAVDTITGAK